MFYRFTLELDSGLSQIIALSIKVTRLLPNYKRRIPSSVRRRTFRPDLERTDTVNGRRRKYRVNVLVSCNPHRTSIRLPCLETNAKGMLFTPTLALVGLFPLFSARNSFTTLYNSSVEVLGCSSRGGAKSD